MSPTRLPPSGSARQEATKGGSTLTFTAGEQTVKDANNAARGSVRTEYSTYKASKLEPESSAAVGKVTLETKYEIHHVKREHKKPNGDIAYDDSEVAVTSKRTGNVIGSMSSGPIRTFVENKNKRGVLRGVATITAADGDNTGFIGGKVVAEFKKDFSDRTNRKLSKVTWIKPTAPTM